MLHDYEGEEWICGVFPNGSYDNFLLGLSN